MAGRKPMGVVATLIRLPAGVASKIDAAAGGKNKRAAFMRGLVDAALAKADRAAKATEKAKAKPRHGGGKAPPTKAAKPKATAKPKRPVAAKLTRARPKPKTAAKRAVKARAAAGVNNPLMTSPLLRT